jgi:hypothetical protein
MGASGMPKVGRSKEAKMKTATNAAVQVSLTPVEIMQLVSNLTQSAAQGKDTMITIWSSDGVANVLVNSGLQSNNVKLLAVQTTDEDGEITQIFEGRA